MIERKMGRGGAGERLRKYPAPFHKFPFAFNVK